LGELLLVLGGLVEALANVGGVLPPRLLLQLVEVEPHVDGRPDDRVGRLLVLLDDLEDRPAGLPRLADLGVPDLARRLLVPLGLPLGEAPTMLLPLLLESVVEARLLLDVPLDLLLDLVEGGGDVEKDCAGLVPLHRHRGYSLFFGTSLFTSASCFMRRFVSLM